MIWKRNGQHQGNPTVLVLTLVLALGLLLWIGDAAAAAPAWSGDPERSSKGEVDFVLTPRDVSGGRFRVDIVLTTHGGDLAELNLQEAAELRVDGKTLKPLKAVPLRGHHARERLEFALDRMPDAFEIVIRGVRGMGDLTFRWP